MSQELLLHPNLLNDPVRAGSNYAEILSERIGEVAAETDSPDPNVSILIRSCNERPRVEKLLEDINRQIFDGEIQLIFVDTDSVDGTREVAKEHGAELVPIAQSDYSHPKSLNAGIRAADFPYVMTLVSHSNLTNRLALRSVTRWTQDPGFGGAYGPVAFPDSRASIWDSGLFKAMRLHRRLDKAASIDNWEGGAMVAHRSVLSRDVWAELGGYDLAYGSGGEDTDMAKRMLDQGFNVVREPALSVFHSHGLGLKGTLKQAADYYRMRQGEPAPFNSIKLAYREDLQLNTQQA